jgi:hypothetical protein
MWRDTERSSVVTTDELNFVLSIVNGINPRDETEALATQMAAIHNATMVAGRRLAHVETIPQQDTASNMSNKLARTFASQLEALKKYCSAGEQTIKVQHVTVNDGGQAIVGKRQPRRRQRLITRADATRAEIVLLAADGYSNNARGSSASRARPCSRGADDSQKERFDRLSDEPDAEHRKIGDERIEEIVTLSLETKPVNATQWSTWGMAKASGVSGVVGVSHWQAFSLQPHRVETFKLSTDPQFIEKVRDIVGLYLAPPERAVVLCVGEKNQIQSA